VQSLHDNPIRARQAKELDHALDMKIRQSQEKLMSLRDVAGTSAGGGASGLRNLANTSFHGGFLTSTKNPLSLKEDITSTTSSIRSRNHQDFQYSAPGLTSALNSS